MSGKTYRRDDQHASGANARPEIEAVDQPRNVKMFEDEKHLGPGWSRMKKDRQELQKRIAENSRRLNEDLRAQKASPASPSGPVGLSRHVAGLHIPARCA